MRAVHSNIKPTSTLAVAVKPAEPKPVVQRDPMVEAVKNFPSQLYSILKNLPAPVIAPRPPGAWIIDVNRDKEGKMSQMTAKFHESK